MPMQIFAKRKILLAACKTTRVSLMAFGVGPVELLVGRRADLGFLYLQQAILISKNLATGWASRRG